MTASPTAREFSEIKRFTDVASILEPANTCDKRIDDLIRELAFVSLKVTTDVDATKLRGKWRAVITPVDVIVADKDSVYPCILLQLILVRRSIYAAVVRVGNLAILLGVLVPVINIITASPLLAQEPVGTFAKKAGGLPEFVEGHYLTNAHGKDNVPASSLAPFIRAGAEYPIANLSGLAYPRFACCHRAEFVEGVRGESRVIFYNI